MGLGTDFHTWMFMELYVADLHQYIALLKYHK
jgi:hypothetical protein